MSRARPCSKAAGPPSARPRPIAMSRKPVPPNWSRWRRSRPPSVRRQAPPSCASSWMRRRWLLSLKLSPLELGRGGWIFRALNGSAGGGLFVAFGAALIVLMAQRKVWAHIWERERHISGGQVEPRTWSRCTARAKSTARGGAYEDSSVARSASGGAARGERGQEGRDHHPGHGQGEAAGGQGDRRRQRQGHRRGQEDPARREGRGQDSVREVLRLRGQAR